MRLAVGPNAGQDLQLPIIHLNGTSKEELMQVMGAISDALEVAYQAMKHNGPNGRDYYPAGAGAMELAIKQHDARLRAVDAVKEEIDQIAVAVDRS